MIAIILLALASCRNEKTGDQKGDASNEMIEDRSNVELNEDEKEKVLRTLIEEPEKEMIEEKTPVKLQNLKNIDTEKIKREAVAAKEQRENIVSEQVEKSVNKGKSCDQILEEYEKIILKFVESKDDAVLDPLTKWSNDPFFNACKKNKAFKKKIDALDEKMSEIDF